MDFRLYYRFFGGGKVKLENIKSLFSVVLFFFSLLLDANPSYRGKLGQAELRSSIT
jgi:hypothetical protein